MLRAQSGSADAFATLYDRYRPAIQGYCRSRLNSTDDGDDAAQDAFLRAWRAIDSFGGDGNFGGWLRTIARNVCTDVLRTRGRTVAMAELESLPVTVAPGNVDDALMARSDSALVSTALGRLTDRHRQILHMREYTGWTYEHIADHERLELNAVKSLVWRARQALRREVLELAQGAPALLGLAGLLHRLARRLNGGRLGELQRIAMRLSETAGQIGAGTAVSAASIAVAVGGPALVPVLPLPAPRAAIVVPSTPDASPPPFGRAEAVVAPVIDAPVGMAGLGDDPSPAPAADQAPDSRTPGPISDATAADSSAGSAPDPVSPSPSADASGTPATVVTAEPPAATSTGTTAAPPVSAAPTKTAPKTTTLATPGSKAAAAKAAAATKAVGAKAAKTETRAETKADGPAMAPAAAATPVIDDSSMGAKGDEAQGEGPRSSSEDAATGASRPDEARDDRGDGPNNELRDHGRDDAAKGPESPGRANGHNK